MKKTFYLYLFFCVALLCSCETEYMKRQKEKDRLFKDSLALAEGNRALGNFYFGMSRDSFEKGKELLLEKYDYKLVGERLQTVDAEFTDDGQLWRLIFVSPRIKEKKREQHPFYEIASKKFGAETAPGVWKVGKRTITLTSEYRQMDRVWHLREGFKRALDGMTIPEYPLLEEFDYYVMSIKNDSLEAVHKKELKIREEFQREQHLLKLEEQEKALQKQLEEL